MTLDEQPQREVATIMRDSEKWLTHEDTICKPDRVARLDWLTSITPEAEYLTFPAGLTAKYLFEEARYSFVYGQFLASILLGFAFIQAVEKLVPPDSTFGRPQP